MQKVTKSGVAGNTPASVDWEAYAALQSRRLKRTDSFGCRCIHDAEERLLSGAQYKNHGEHLAKSLERDCRKSTRLRRSQPMWDSDDADLSSAESGLEGARQVTDPDELDWATQTLRQFFSMLPQRFQHALNSLGSGVPQVRAAATLGVAERQYRNVCTTAIRLVRSSPNAMQALAVLRDAGASGGAAFRALLEDVTNAREEVMAA